MKTTIVALAALLLTGLAGAQTLEQAQARFMSIGPVWPHPTQADSLTCFGVPPRNSFMGAQARISVENGKVKALLRDADGLSPDFLALAKRLGLDGKHEVLASWSLKDCRVSPSGRWECYGRSRVELVGLVIAGEKAWFESDAFLVADRAQATLVANNAGARVVQRAGFGPRDCR